MTWFWAALLVAGLVVLGLTLVLVVGGLVDGSPRPAAAGRPARPGRRGEGRRPRPGASRARTILDERYAAGELSTEQYEHRRAVLSQGEGES